MARVVGPAVAGVVDRRRRRRRLLPHQRVQLPRRPRRARCGCGRRALPGRHQPAPDRSCAGRREALALRPPHADGADRARGRAAPEHRSRSTSTSSCPCSPPTTLHSGPNVLGLRSSAASAPARSLGALVVGVARRAPASRPARRHGRLRRRPARCSRPQQSLLAACALLFVDRAQLHAVDVERQLDRSSSARPTTCAAAWPASTTSRSTAPARPAGILAGWLAAKGGTELAFVVSGVVAMATAVWAAARLQRDGRLAGLPALRLGGAGARGR